MADKKISQLTALSAANLAPSTDVLAIVDTSATETKKIVAQDLINGVLNVASAVGIGTASPSFALQVETNTNAAAGSFIRNANTGASAAGNLSVASAVGNLIFRAHSAAHSVWPNQTLIQSDSGFTNGLAILTAGANPLSFWTNSTERMRLDSSGNLGIGTTSPADTNSFGRALDIRSSTGAAAYFRDSDDATKYSVAGFFGADSNAYYGSWGTGTGVLFYSAGSERARITSGGNFCIGSSEPGNAGTINLSVGNPGVTSGGLQLWSTTTGTHYIQFGDSTSGGAPYSGAVGYNHTDNALLFWTNQSEKGRFTSAGELLIGQTAGSINVTGAYVTGAGQGGFCVSSSPCILVNRKTSDGTLVSFRQDNTEEGDISVSGTTVSYNGGHLSRYSQTTDNTQIPLVKGTVMSNLDQMAMWEKDGQPLPNEQLNCMKVSDVEGDVNVAGVFVNWNYDEEYGTNDMNVAMTGDMIIRIAQGVVVQRGDLLMSAGDGTAKPQGDDIRRSKTIAKVTSNHVTCTYEDGSYCVPCVLMAC